MRQINDTHVGADTPPGRYGLYRKSSCCQVEPEPESAVIQFFAGSSLTFPSGTVLLSPLAHAAFPLASPCCVCGYTYVLKALAAEGGNAGDAGGFFKGMGGRPGGVQTQEL